jgi:hypothetical protein
MKYLFVLFFSESERYNCVVPWGPLFLWSLSHWDKRKAFPNFFGAVLEISGVIRKAINCVIFRHGDVFSVGSKMRRQAGDRLFQGTTQL